MFIDLCKSFLIKCLLFSFIKLPIFDSNIPFSKLALLLNKKNILNKTSKILSILLENKISPIRVKTFLSIFMIIHHPKVILNDETNIEKDVLKLANDLKDLLLKMKLSKNKFEINFYHYLFEKKIKLYFESFDKWKELDKEKILNDLCIVYFELDVEIHRRLQNKSKKQEDNTKKEVGNNKETTITDKKLKHDDIPIKNNNQLNNNKLNSNLFNKNSNLFNKNINLFNKNNNNDEVFINDLKREQRSILNKIKKMDGMNYFNKIVKQKETYEKQISKMYENIGVTLHQAFWDSIKKELEKEPPNFMVIVSLLTDLKNMMMSCVPNRKDIHNDIEIHIDTEFISDMIKNQCIDDGYILNMINFIIGYLKRFQSKSDDKKNKEWQDSINDKFVKGIKYADFFPMFFRDIFEKFESILKEMELLKSMTIYDDIKERFKDLKQK